MYSEYNRTSGAETGTTTGERTLARARLALSARGTMCTSRLCETKSGVAQAERLAHPHACFCQQRQQEPVPQVLGGCGQDGDNLLGCQGARRLSRDVQLHRPHRTGLPLGHMVQERFVRTAADSPPGHQLGGHPEAGPVVWS